MDFKEIKKNWEVKLRKYRLVGDGEPPLRQIRSKHTYKSQLMIFDEDKKENRELRYASNQKTPFVDDQDEKDVRIEHLYLTDGILVVDRQAVALQQFLAIHPDNRDNGGVIFYEVRPEYTAEEETEFFTTKADAYAVISSLDIDEVSAIIYEQSGDSVFSTSTKILKRDLYVTAEDDPQYIIDVVDNKFIFLKYLARKAVKFNVLTFADSDRTVKWSSNKKTLTSIPADKTPWEAIADFFLTDDGVPAKAKIIELLNKK